MEKEKLANENLYVLCMTETGAPFLMKNEFFLVYTNKEKADERQEYYSKKYIKGMPISVKEIENNNKFFETMNKFGFNKFLLDGDGEIFDITKIFGLTADNASITLHRIMLYAQMKRLRAEFLSGKDVNIYLEHFYKNIADEEFYYYESDIQTPIEDEKGKWLFAFLDSKSAAERREVNEPVKSAKLCDLFEFEEELFKQNANDLKSSFQGVAVCIGDYIFKFDSVEYINMCRRIAGRTEKEITRENRWKAELAKIDSADISKMAGKQKEQKIEEIFMLVAGIILFLLSGTILAGGVMFISLVLGLSMSVMVLSNSNFSKRTRISKIKCVCGLGLIGLAFIISIANL